jgi:glycosyltransferase involved in cell wall biosynthesis
MSKPIRLLNVVAHIDPKFGGISSSLPDYCLSLYDTGEVVPSILALCEGGESAPSISDAVAVHTLPLGRAKWLTSASLRQSMSSRIAQADVVHIHGLWQEHSQFAARACQQLQKPYIVSAHGMLDTWALRNKGLKKAVYGKLIEYPNLRRASRLRALTSAEESDYQGLGMQVPIDTIPNGVKPAPATHDPRPLFNRFPQLEGRPFLLFLGRVHFKKGLDILVSAWRNVIQQYPDARLLIAGPDSENTLPQVKADIARFGLENSVVLGGFFDKELKWSSLGQASAFVLPSYSEGFSMASLEAMSAGCPVILSHQCYFPEVTREGCGWLIDPTEASLTAACCACLQESPSTLKDHGARGRALVAREYTWKRVAEKSIDSFRSALR